MIDEQTKNKWYKGKKIHTSKIWGINSMKEKSQQSQHALTHPW